MAATSEGGAAQRNFGVVFRGVGEVAYEEIAMPQIEAPGDAVVQVLAAGLCGSDLHPFFGREQGLDPVGREAGSLSAAGTQAAPATTPFTPLRSLFPITITHLHTHAQGTVMGHEFVGRVVAVGPAAQATRLGSMVISPFSTACGDCFHCRRQWSGRCAQAQLFGWRSGGRGLHGGQAAFVRVPLADSTLVAAPDGMDAATALLFCDIIPTGYHAVRNAGLRPRVAESDSDSGGDDGDRQAAAAAKQAAAAVIGLGPVGLMATAIACGWCADQVGTVACIDSVPERLAQAAKFGGMAVPLVETADKAAAAPATAAAVREQLPPECWLGSAVECVGHPSALRLAFELVNPHGTLSSIGVHSTADFGFSPVDCYDKNITFRAGRCPGLVGDDG